MNSANLLLQLRPLNPYFDNQKLPTFSDFLSKTFSEDAWEGNNRLDRTTNSSSKIYSISSESSGLRGSTNQYVRQRLQASVINKEAKELEDAVLCSGFGMDNEDRTSSKGIPSRSDHCEIGEIHYDLGVVKDVRHIDSASPCIQFPCSEIRKDEVPQCLQTSQPPIKLYQETGEQPPEKRRPFTRPEKCYECSFCPLFFRYQKHLIMHVKEIHRNRKPFGCPREECWQRFGGLGDVNRHVRTVHDGEKPFSCLVCRRSFSRRSGLKRHTIHVHRASYT